MRIAFVSFETVAHRETETNARLQTVIELFRDRGHDVHVLCAQFWPGEKSTLERDDISYHGVSVGLEARPSFLLRLPFVLWSLRPDVIHASSEPPRQVTAADWGATFARAPLFVEWYGEQGVDDDRWSRWAATRPNMVITPSRLVSTWVRELGANTDRVRVVANPIDLERIDAIEPAEADPNVVYARRLDEDANLESLLLALAELRGREWSATVIGDGPEREAFETLASDLRIDDRVSFVGETSLDERLAIYRSAHAFVQTATECVFPTELLWAIAAGCVSIVEYHADSSAHELVEGWDRGFRVTSERELTRAIVDAGDLEHRTLDERFETFDRKAILERYLQEYEDVLGGRR